MSSPNEIERWINDLSTHPAIPPRLEQLRAEVEVLAQQAQISPELAQEWLSRIASRTRTPSIESGGDTEGRESSVPGNSGTGSPTGEAEPSSSIPLITPSSSGTSSIGETPAVNDDSAATAGPPVVRKTRTRQWQPR